MYSTRNKYADTYLLAYRRNVEVEPRAVAKLRVTTDDNDLHNGKVFAHISLQKCIRECTLAVGPEIIHF